MSHPEEDSRPSGIGRVYLALGDSMSIDKYTGVAGGGAVSQFHQWLGTDWSLVDKTCDGCTMDELDPKTTGDLITLTISGNDALEHMDRVAAEGAAFLIQRHRNLLSRIRRANPDSCLIVGNVYSPQTSLTENLESMLSQLNAGIANHVREVDGCLADIHSAFYGNEATHLCFEIEPSLAGATAIANLFVEQYSLWRDSRPARSLS